MTELEKKAAKMTGREAAILRMVVGSLRLRSEGKIKDDDFLLIAIYDKKYSETEARKKLPEIKDTYMSLRE